MNKTGYLGNSDVKSFLCWVSTIIDGEPAFKHQYFDNSTKSDWSCTSLFNAYERYDWKGSNYNKTEEKLNNYSTNINKSLKENNPSSFKICCSEILKWGGVMNGNYAKINGMDNVIAYFKDAIERLNPEKIDTTDDVSNILMSAGFTKIYSLLIKDFIIYDSRVGSALCLLVRLYLEKNDKKEIPDVLKFSWAVKKMGTNVPRHLNYRNPNNEIYKFSYLTKNRPHTISNTKANWLIYEISKLGKFKDSTNPMRAVESALFMIGYDVKNHKGNN